MAHTQNIGVARRTRNDTNTVKVDKVNMGVSLSDKERHECSVVITCDVMHKLNNEIINWVKTLKNTENPIKSEALDALNNYKGETKSSTKSKPLITNEIAVPFNMKNVNTLGNILQSRYGELYEAVEKYVAATSQERYKHFVALEKGYDLVENIKCKIYRRLTSKSISKKSTVQVDPNLQDIRETLEQSGNFAVVTKVKVVRSVGKAGERKVMIEVKLTDENWGNPHGTPIEVWLDNLCVVTKGGNVCNLKETETETEQQEQETQTTATAGTTGTETLPEGWSSHQDDNGQTYYFNTLKKYTQWDVPTQPAKDSVKQEGGRSHKSSSRSKSSKRLSNQSDSEKAKIICE